MKRVTLINGSFLSSEPISIHTLCEEGDISAINNTKIFSISIHTLCEEGDDYP